jgi:hypothetical protein
MPKRFVAVILAAVLSLSGCKVKTVQQVPSAGMPPQLSAKQMIVRVTTVKGEDVPFDPPGAAITGGTVSGTFKKQAVSLPLDQVQRFWVQTTQISTARTVGLVAGLTAGVVIIAVAAAEANKKSTTTTPTTTTTPCTGNNCIGSCPSVYSWDGTRYVFEAEPYGGAITRGLEKDDYSELGQLKEEDGRYKLRITNEVNETQMTNLAELWVVDHPAGTRVVPDINGKLHTVSSQQNMLSAHDAEGHDLLPWLRSTDHLIWEPHPVPDATGSLRGDIIMTFPKPAGATQVKLVVNATTGLWGSYMIKNIVELRGRDVGKFYFALNHSSTIRKHLTAWEEREELYRLKVYVDEPTGWHVRGILPGTGSFNSADRILPLDVSHVQGDQLRIRIHPPAGFWALNSFAADYSPDLPLTVEKLKPATAQDLQGRSVLPELAAVDGRYLAMPEIGDTADVTFSAPPDRAGTERAVFLHTRGYYKLHIAGTGEPDKATLKAFEKVPGSAVRFAAAQYGQVQLAEQQQTVATGQR